MILIDFGHLSSRILHTAVGQAKPTKNKETKKLNTDEWIAMYFHMLLKNIAYIKGKFENEYGDIVICVDNKDNWRKRVYPEYKGNRASKRAESDIDYESFYKYQDELIDELRTNFPFKVLKVDKCEADDIIGVLAKRFSAVQKTVVISSDKDFKQVLEFGSLLYDPMTKVFVNMNQLELKEWKTEHILLGDAVDNIPNIKQQTEFTDEFRKYITSKGIHKDIKVNEFLKLSIAKPLMEEFDEFEIIKSGKLKGQKSDIKKIFKRINFGEKDRYNFAKDLTENLKSNVMYQENYDRNKTLVLFECIPEDIQEEIVKAYKESEYHFDPAGIMSFLGKYHLLELLKSVSDFYTNQTSLTESRKQANNSLSDWDN